MNTRLDTRPVRTAKAVYARLIALGAKDPEGRPGFLRDFVEELYRLGSLLLINPDWAVVQAAVETGHPTKGFPPFVSKIYLERGNIGGIGVTDEYDYGYGFQDGTTAARAMMAHLYVYIYGDRNLNPHIEPYVHLDPRWDDVIRKQWQGTVKTVDDLSGKWATNPRYGEIIRERYPAIILAAEEPAPEEVEEDVDDIIDRIVDIVEDNVSTNRHIYAIGMGHRNTNYGGARGEFDWTPGCARALRDAINARGGNAYLIQEHDGDNDPNFSVGKNLTQAARVGTDTIANRYGPITAILFCHYNGGGGPGAHFIYPDGWVAPDRGVDNPLDIKLARAIKKHLARTNTVGFLHWRGWRGPEPGVMSEKDTGAVSGRYGYRLGELTGTIQHRAHAVRLIIEAGSIDTSDKQYITNPTWVRYVYCEAIVDALEEVFGKMPKGKPVTPPTESVYVKPIERKWADDAITSGVPFVVLQDKNHKAGYTRWWRVDRNYMTTEEVARQQVATDSSKFLNEPIPANTPIWVEFVGENYKGDPYGLTPWGTMVRMEKLKVIDWPNQPDLHAEKA